MRVSSPLVYRRPSGIYAVRMVVPLRLRHMVGKRELHATTGERDWRKAQMAALRIQLSLREGLMALEATAALAGEGMMMLGEVARLAGCDLHTLLVEMSNESPRPSLSMYVQGITAWSVLDADLLERDGLGYVWASIQDHGTQTTITGSVRLPSSVLGALVAGNGSARVGELPTGDASALILDDWLEIDANRCLAPKEVLRAVFPRVHRSGLTGADSRPEMAVTPSPAPLAPKPKRVNEMFELMRLSDQNNGRDQGTTERRAPVIRYFIELMGDMWMHEIDHEVALRFAKGLEGMPENTHHAKLHTAKRLGKRNDDVAMADLLHAVKAGYEPGKSRRGVARLMQDAGNVWEVAKVNGSTFPGTANPFRKAYGVGRHDKGRAKDSKEIFEPAVLGKIFSAEWFRVGHEDSKHWRPFYYWLPLVCLYTASRITEGAQLYLDDIKHDAAVGWYFRIDEDEAGQRTKNLNSVRHVPMHPELVRLGLPQYVEALRAAGHRRLFPEIGLNPKKGYGKYAGQWFNERFMKAKLGIERDGTQTTHSFRHTFITAMDRLGLTDDERRLLRQIAGHEVGESVTDHTYTKDRPLEDLVGLMRRLSFDGMPGITRFDIPAGLAAVRQALGIKARAKRAKAAERLP